MNSRVCDLARKLQSAVESADPVEQRDTLVWAHGFLTSVLHSIEARVPGLAGDRTLRQQASDDLEQIRQNIWAVIDQKLKGFEDGEDEHVLARRKPGPKGLSGGAAVRPPDSDLPM